MEYTSKQIELQFTFEINRNVEIFCLHYGKNCYVFDCFEPKKEKYRTPIKFSGQILAHGI